MLYDGHGRKVDYLRISVTQRCNFRCQYCMPFIPFSHQPKEHLLSFEELFSFIKVAIDEGINKIRITGGEPLLRKDLDKFIFMISSYKKDIDIALTTNAYYLSKMAKRLHQAGLKRVNISLDTLKPERAKQIAQKDVLFWVLKGIDAAFEVGLKIKLNCVPLKDINDDELCELLEYAKQISGQIRFIEYMENTHANSHLVGLNAKEVLEILAQNYNFSSLMKSTTSPAEHFICSDGYVFGIINPHKHNFCEDCNRIRLTAEGLLIPCLYFDEAKSIKDQVRAGNIEAASKVLRDVLQNKPEKNRWTENEENESSARGFFQTGG